MTHRIFLYALLLVGVTQLGYAQLFSLEVPVEQKVRSGEEIRIGLKILDHQHYTLRMEGQPKNAVLENREFRWTPGKEDQKHYLVTFYLLDSNQTTVDETSLSLTVIPPSASPYLVFDQTLPDTIRLTENKSFAFSAHIKSNTGSDPRTMWTYFTFNENPSLRTFDSCQVTVIGDQLLFRWTPSNREALQEHLKFRITIVDTDQSIFSQVLNFNVQNVNQPPYFNNEIPDTIYYSSTQGLSIDFAASDPDQDNLKCDYSPKNPEYGLQGSNIVFKPEHDARPAVPLTVKVSDGHTSIKRTITVIRSEENTIANPFLQPVIGDFTKKIFSEGDSVLTYLNISNNINLKDVDITYTDLSLPTGINSLTKHLVFEKNGSYIKVYSKGILPYSLVDRNYNYNISVLISSRIPNRKPAFRVLVLTVENKPDPQNITHQKDSIVQAVNHFLEVEKIYQSTLDKVRNRISRPWWKKVAIVTGTLSGVLTIVQSENPDKTTSVVSASISLLSIMVSNIPSFFEKTLTQVDEKIAHSKTRTERLQEKETEFRYNWSIDMEQEEFDKMKAEVTELLNKSLAKRNEDICSLAGNKKVRSKIKTLSKSKNAT
ncbi:MAG TPA: hypothetical protein VK750_02345, partial [Cytophagaceae bacterium]|nr:hypothetical protein [Cytophagaceae bacterium]